MATTSTWDSIPLPKDDYASKSRELLAEDQLIHLKSYRYQSVDKSWISNHILKHYWNFMVELLPRWLAPNAVTLVGFAFIVLNVVCLEIVMPDMVGPGPSWLYWSFAFGIWAYSTMDNIDGKQARRTGTSSPLGELFDHGIDSLNCTLASLMQSASLGFGTTRTGAFTVLLPCLPMWFSTWETYHSHVLYLGYFNGPTEGLLIATILMAISGACGPEIWNVPMKDTIGLEWLVGGNSFNDIWVYILGGGFLFAHLPFCIWNVIEARKRDGLPVAPVFLEWLPIAAFTAGCAGWLWSPHTTLLRDNHLVLFGVTMSFVFGRMTTKIILAHLTRQPFPHWTMMLVPLLGGALLAHLPDFGLPALSAAAELNYLRAYFMFAVVVYFRWAHLVINAICNYLGINCLTIPSRSVPPPLGGFNGMMHDKRAA